MGEKGVFQIVGWVVGLSVVYLEIGLRWVGVGSNSAQMLLFVYPAVANIVPLYVFEPSAYISAARDRVIIVLGVAFLAR